MKRVSALFLTLLLVLSLAACGGGDKPGEDAAPAPDLGEFFSQLQGSYEGLDALAPLEGESLDALYPGLSAIEMESMLVQETMMSTANCAVVLITLPAGASEEDLQARMDQQASGGAWYSESCETWEKGVIVSASRSVGMFVYPEEAQAMADEFTAAFGG